MPKLGNAQPSTPTCHPERRHIAKGLCKQCYDLEYAKSNKERVNAKKRDWRLRNQDKARAIGRKYRYGVSAADVNERLATQGGKCAICREADATALDHCHKTGAFRGMLCGPCNRGIGLLGDDPSRLARAAEYLMSEQ